MLVLPALPLVMLTLRTVSVLTGVILVMRFLAGGTIVNMSTQGSGSALSNVLQCSSMAGQHALTIFVQVGSAIPVNNVCQRTHDRLSMSALSFSIARASDFCVR